MGILSVDVNTNQLLQDFYDLSELCGDNLEIVCEIVHFHHSQDERIGRVRSDILDWSEIERLERYAKTFDKILSLPNIYIKTFIAVKMGKINSAVVKIDRSKIEQQKEKLEKREHHIQSLFEEYL